jgi:adenosylhomocysteine nucleosidase
MMNPRGTILVCFALKDEARAFQRLVKGWAGVDILITGIGRKNADRAARDHLGANSPGEVFTCGFAGGLDPRLQTGDVVFLTVDPMLDRHLVQAGARPGRFYCAERMAVTAREKSRLREQTGADAVEMESGAIHAVCRERGIPCATVRAISDTAREDLPLDFNRFSKADSSLDYLKLFGAVAKSPGTIPALLRLRRNSSAAAQRLAEVLGLAIRGK